MRLLLFQYIFLVLITLNSYKLAAYQIASLKIFSHFQIQSRNCKSTSLMASPGRQMMLLCNILYVF